MRMHRAAVATGIALLGLAVTASPVFPAAKDCRKLCATEIASCVSDAKSANDCKGVKGSAGRACRKDRRHAIKLCGSSSGPILTGCKASPSTSSCS